MNPRKIEAILPIWKLRLVEEVISTELRSLPMASTHAFVAAGRGATFSTFAGTDPVVLVNWISDFDTHLTSRGVAEGYAEAALIVLDRIKEIATKRPNLETKLRQAGASHGALGCPEPSSVVLLETSRSGILPLLISPLGDGMPIAS